MKSNKKRAKRQTKLESKQMREELVSKMQLELGFKEFPT